MSNILKDLQLIEVTGKSSGLNCKKASNPDKTSRKGERQ